MWLARKFFVNIVEIIFEGKQKQKQDLAQILRLHIKHHLFWSCIHISLSYDVSVVSLGICIYLTDNCNPTRYS